MDSKTNSNSLINTKSQDSGIDIKTLFKDACHGRIKDKYHFEKKLSSGGFGVVYLA